MSASSMERRRGPKWPGVGPLRALPLAALLATVGATAGACASSPAKPVNGLEVIISADGLSAPADFDDLKLEVSQQTGSGFRTLWGRDYVVPSAEATLPTTFTLLAGQSPDEVLLAVTAYKSSASGPQPVVQRVAQVQVPTDRMALLYLVLAQRCVGQVAVTGAEGEPISTCPIPGQSCQPDTGTCGSNAIDKPLPTYTPGQSLDAGPPSVDATLPEAIADGSAETGPPAGCAVGTASCSGPQPQTCASTGSWQNIGAACANQTCVVLGGKASCAGVCALSQTHPVACGNCGTDTQPCNASGAWVTSGTCASQGACAQNATQSCNTYGTQTCSSSCAWGGCSCASTPVCTPTATQCSASDNGVVTCNGCGQWASAVACSGATPACANGACVGVPRSCQTSGAGQTSCPAGTGSESCCTSPEVTPNGSYYRTYTNSGSGPTGEADLATVSGFRLDKYLVTVGRFRQFVAAWNGGAGWTPPAGSGKHTHLNGGRGLNATGGGYEPGWLTSDNSNLAPTNANLACDSTYQTWTNTAGSEENLPINCVNWFESYAFCIWDGGFLPSEAEWEYAAAGGSQQREYPWGTASLGTACPGTGCQYAIYNCDYPSGSGSCTSVGNIAPVGYAASGAGLWGQLDLTGNMWEWNLDWYATYAACTDCVNFTTASSRVIRGGNFYNPAPNLLPPYLYDFPPADRYDSIGLRCSRTP